LVPQAGATPLRVSQLRNLHHPPGKVALPTFAASQQQAPTRSSLCVSTTRRGNTGSSSRNDDCKISNIYLPYIDRYNQSISIATDGLDIKWAALVRDGIRCVDSVQILWHCNTKEMYAVTAINDFEDRGRSHGLQRWFFKVKQNSLVFKVQR
jgi:hypothetical protein